MTPPSTLGRWPWRRAIHAALLDRLQGARAVGLDVIFAEPDTINPNDDAILADSLRRNGRAVLPVVLDRLDHPGSMSLPIRRWPRPRRAGFINARIDADGVVRESVLRVHYDGDWWRHRP